MLTVVLLGAAMASHAGVSISIGIGFPLLRPPVIYAPPHLVVAPVYVPPPVCAAPVPVMWGPVRPVMAFPPPAFCAPRPICAPRVVYAPLPRYCAPAPVWHGGYRHGYGHGGGYAYGHGGGR